MGHYKILGNCSLMMAAAFASAQYTNSDFFNNKPIWISAGWNELVDKGVNQTGFVVGVGYHLTSTGGGKDTISYSPSLDLTWARNSGKGGRADAIALLAMARSPFSTLNKRNSGGMIPYYGLGIGIVDDQVSFNAIPGTSSGGSSGTSTGGTPHRSDNKWNFAARGLLGISFSDMFFAEAAYNYYGSVLGQRLDSVSVTVGVKF
jgi:hypothetical protein